MAFPSTPLNFTSPRFSKNSTLTLGKILEHETYAYRS